MRFKSNAQRKAVMARIKFPYSVQNAKKYPEYRKYSQEEIKRIEKELSGIDGVTTLKENEFEFITEDTREDSAEIDVRQYKEIGDGIWAKVSVTQYPSGGDFDSNPTIIVTPFKGNRNKVLKEFYDYVKKHNIDRRKKNRYYVAKKLVYEPEGLRF